MNFEEILKKPESRRLEFKEKADNLEKIIETLIAFSNGSGGELYIGVRDSDRTVIGVREDELFPLEERITSALFDGCRPHILPDISVLNYNEKLILKITVYPGNQKPYFLSKLGKMKGTVVRVGSTNRKADETIIMEMKRRRRNVSFDSELVYSQETSIHDLSDFIGSFAEITGKKLKKKDVETLGLIKKERNAFFPTNAALLLTS